MTAEILLRLVEWIGWTAMVANVVLALLNWRLLRRAQRLNAALDALATEHYRVLRFLAWPAARHFERPFTSTKRNRTEP